MPPQRVKKQAVLQDITSSFPAPAPAPDTPAETRDIATTPQKSPSRRTIKITEAQKQALMDNLQLEVTERARKLRSQYGLLAQGLRSRLEMRVNRIPQGLRKMNILELVEKYSEQENAQPNAALSISTKPDAPRTTVQPPAKRDETSASPGFTRGKKRSSEVFAEDKENVQQELALPKKRAKAAAPSKAPATANRAVRQVSRQDVAQVLSPKSNNSRTWPRSPFKSGPEDPFQKSPQKSNLGRPVSPSKENSRPGTAASGKIGRPAVTTTAKTGKRAVAAAPRKRVSNASSEGAGTDASTGTTVVTKGTKKKAPPAATKKTGATRATGATAASKKAATAKKEKENAPTATGGRVLRARR